MHNNRIEYISMASVVSALAVIFLHTNDCFWTFSTARYWFSANIIESVFYFAVPIFFMISGAMLIGYNDRYDLKTDSGISVEVKASGYIQSWKQRELSKPVFSVKPTRAWDSETYKYACEAKRQADVYVFCLHNYEYRDEGLNPLDMNQWDFYVIATKKLDEIMPTQKTVTLSKLKRLNAMHCDYDNLKHTIKNAISKR